MTMDKNKWRKLESDWEYGYLLAVNPSTTEYLIGSDDDMFSCATIRRLQDDKAFDTSVIREMAMRYRDYIIEGARSFPSRGQTTDSKYPNCRPRGSTAGTEKVKAEDDTGTDWTLPKIDWTRERLRLAKPNLIQRRTNKRTTRCRSKRATSRAQVRQAKS